jgi:hypothetical protein
MGRFPQRPALKGSQRWIQRLVNDAPDRLNQAIGIGHIHWRSPVADDDFAEYRDGAFLARLNVSPERRPLSAFWPTGGPQWDALGVAASGEAVLVEAKAHVNELYSPASAASESSLARIQLSLRECRRALGVRDEYDWSKQCYQYANRLAHAHWLEALNGVPVRLVFLYLIGDVDMNGPNTMEEWGAAIQTVHHMLGLVHVPPFVVDAFIDVREFL